MMTPERIKEVFAKSGAIVTGSHFVYAKKPDGHYHGRDYVNKDAVYAFPETVNNLCRDISCHFRGLDPEVVVGPTVGGVALAQWTAYCLSLGAGQEVFAVFADEEDVLEKLLLSGPLGLQAFEFNAFGSVGITASVGLKNNVIIGEINCFVKKGTKRIIKRGYDKLIAGKRCLIVEDIINSGSTVVKTRDAVVAAGGTVIGVGCLCNRSSERVTAQTLGVQELFSLLNLNMEMFPEDNCPICKENGFESVRTDLGKGKEFLVRKGLVAVSEK